MRRRTVLRSAAAGLLSGLAGCSSLADVTSQPATGAGRATAASSTTQARDATPATVVHVVDGDTVVARLPSGEETLRLLGVDTPEAGDEVFPEEFDGVPDTAAGRTCLRRIADRATAYTRDRLAGERVALRFDPSQGRRDTYGRLLVYIAVDGEPFNVDLVRRGDARVFDSGFERQARFLAVERRARDRGHGVWGCS